MGTVIYTVHYYKLGNKWYLDYPPYIDDGGNPDDLERIGYFHDFLEFVSAGAHSLSFLMSVDPIKGADVMTLIGGSGDNTGGYYLLERFQGKELKYELWMNTVLYHQQNELPQKIYIKPVM